jgi:ferredoxin
MFATVNSGWKVEADRDVCIGSGSCAFAVPDVFDVDETGGVVLVGPVVTGDERVAEAVAGCPTGALKLIKGDG